MKTNLKITVKDLPENRSDKNTHIKELQYCGLIGKIPAQEVHPQIKKHGNHIWNDALFLGTQENALTEFQPPQQEHRKGRKKSRDPEQTE